MKHTQFLLEGVKDFGIEDRVDDGIDGGVTSNYQSSMFNFTVSIPNANTLNSYLKESRTLGLKME